MRYLLVIIALLGLAIPGVSLPPALTLTATTDTGTTLACARVTPGDMVTLTFTHSMYGGDVREIYRVGREGTLARQHMVADRAAAAEYYARDGRVVATDDGYEVISPPFETHELVVRVDARGDHRLTVGATTWRLADAVPEPTQVRIAVARSSLLTAPCS
jgi:hypothetical protein